MTSRRVTIAAATACAAGLVLAGCVGVPAGSPSTATSSVPAPAGKVSLSMLAWDNGAENRAAWNAAVDGFNASQEGATVTAEFINSDTYDQVLQTRLSGGAGPDIFAIHPVTAGDLNEAGFLHAVDNEPWFGKLNASAQDYARTVGGGKATAFPVVSGISGLIYNKAVFDKAGITAGPATLSEVMADAKKIKAAGYTPFAFGIKDAWFVQMMIYQAIAQDPTGPDSTWEQRLAKGEVRFSESNGRRHGMEIYKSLIPYMLPDPLGTSEQASQAAFLKGEAAIFPSDYINPAGMKAGIDMGHFIFPVSETKPVYYPGGYPVSMALNANNGHEAEASKFIEYLLGDTYPAFLAQVSFFPVIDGVKPDLVPIYKDMQANVEGMTRVDPWPADYWNPGVSDVFLAAMQDLTAGKATVDKVLARMDDANDESLGR